MRGMYEQKAREMETLAEAYQMFGLGEEYREMSLIYEAMSHQSKEEN